MNVSPLDLRQQKFRTTFRGLDPVEVTTFLMAVAEDYEEALRETDRMRQDVSRLEELVRGYAEQEKNLQKTLMSAQKLADDMRAGAEENALRIVRDAEHRSRLLLDKTQARVEDVQRDIDGLKLRKRDIEARGQHPGPAQHTGLRPRAGRPRRQAADLPAAARGPGSPRRLIHPTPSGVEIDVRVIPRDRKSTRLNSSHT